MASLPIHASADAVLDALDPEQRRVAASPLGPMCVLAGAGTGKTRAITHRIAYGVLSGAYQPQRVLAVTFTARAAGEMRTRLRGLGVGGVQARTFHAAALRQLHYFWPSVVGGAAPEVMPSKIGVVTQSARRHGLRSSSSELRDIAAEIEWAKVSMITPDSYAARVAAERREPPGMDATAMARVFRGYEELKSERGLIDFEDVLLLMVGILAEHPEVARAIRGQYRHFVVDEYQDVSRLQQRLLDLWLGERADLCVVGDPAQTIYSFTGASPQFLLNFGQRFPGAQTVELVRNYRSSPQVVRLANLVLSTPGGGRRSGAVVLQAQGEDGPAPELRDYADDVSEAHEVAAAIAALVKGGEQPSRIAVLYRTNGQSEALETALAEHDIAYLVRGGERFFSRSEVRSAILLLRGAARSDDGSVPLGTLTRDVLSSAGLTAAPPRAGAVRAEWESLEALARVAEDLVAVSPQARMRDLVAELDERAAAAHAPTVDGVTLASLHAAKGLEWDTVFIVGCSDGLIPITMAETPQEIEEERRLLYVGVTRARRRLVLTWAAARTEGARASRRPSRFLDSAAPVLGERARSTAKSARKVSAKTRGRAAPSVCRVCGRGLSSAKELTVGRCTTCPAGYDEALFEALREWRLQTARAAGVPAYVVLTDASLTAVAETLPRSDRDLLGIRGIGQAKLESYGADLLAIVSPFSPSE